VTKRRVYKYNSNDVINGLMIIKPIEDNLKVKEYEYQCQKCGYVGIKNEYDIERFGCGVCKGLIVAKGINDIPTTAPWMVKYFQGGEKEASNYTKASSLKFYPKCPECGKIKEKPMRISTLYKNHSIGCICSDGYSIPEKFLYFILMELNVEFIFHYKSEWTNNYIYDFYLPQYNCIVETHGEQHYWYVSDWHIDQTGFDKHVENDKNKHELAIKHVDQYIVIDCRESTIKWLSTNVLKSELSSLFNLNAINFNDIYEKSLKSLCIQVCSDWKYVHDTNILSKTYKLSRATIIRYLHRGADIGLCDYDSLEERRRSTVKAMGGWNSQKLHVVSNNTGIEKYYHSRSDFIKNSEADFGVNITHHPLFNRLKGKESTEYKGLTITKIS